MFLSLSSQLLSEANTTISVLREQLSSLDQSSDANKEAKSIELSSRLQDSTQKLQVISPLEVHTFAFGVVGHEVCFHHSFINYFIATKST